MSKEESQNIKQKLKPRYKKYVLIAFIFLALFLAFVSTVYIVAVSSTIYRNIDMEIETSSHMAIQSANVTSTTDSEGNTSYNITQYNTTPGRQIYVLYYIDDQVYVPNNDIYMYLIPGYAEYQVKSMMGHSTSIESNSIDESKKAANELLIMQAQTGKLNKLLTECVKNNGNYYYFRTESFQNDDASSPIDYYKILIYANDVVKTHSSIINIYVWCLVVDILVILLCSIYIGRLVMKPLEEALDKQMKFVGDASHELRTPLAIVQSNLENTLANSDHTIEDESENIVSSLHEIERLNKLTTELLDLASSDNNTQKYDYTEFNIGDLVSHTGADFMELAQLQNRQLTYTSCDCTITGDVDKIRQLLLILLDNALKYTEEGDSIQLSLTDNGNECVLEVADTGKGISDEAMGHIFERFYREDKAHSREIQGNGLGLSIALVIVNSHHGTIKVSHNEPKGTIFTVTLPKKQK